MSKRELIKDYIQKENYLKALQIASKLKADADEYDLKTIQNGYSYLANPKFYCYLDSVYIQDTIDNAIFLLKSKFL